MYRFSTGVTGLCYVGISLGFLLATFLGVHIANVTYAQVRRSPFIPSSISPRFWRGVSQLLARFFAEALCLVS